MQTLRADVPLTPERQSLYDTLYGESKNEPEKFMSRNITELDLPRTRKVKLSAMQEDRKALLAKGVKLSGAMSELAAVAQRCADRKIRNGLSKKRGV
jgi:hypothetical protein